jgi:hypothetical protein
MLQGVGEVEGGFDRGEGGSNKQDIEIKSGCREQIGHLRKDDIEEYSMEP